MIAEAYLLFLAFQDKLLSEGHYYVFLKEEQRRPSKCFTTLSWGGGTGNGLFQGFPRAFLGLEQAGSPYNLLACNCSLYFLLIFCISVVLVVISPLSFLILFESSVFSSW